MHCKLSYISFFTWFYIQLIVIDPYRPRCNQGMLFGLTLRMLKFHPIPAFMKRIQTSEIILVRVFWLNYIFRI